MIRKVVAWFKLVVSFTVSWFALTFLAFTVAFIATRDAPITLAWALFLAFAPPLGAFFAARWFVNGDFRRIRQEQDAKSAQARAAAQAERDAERWRIRQLLHQQVDRHRPALQRNVHSALVKNDYGLITADRRQDAVLEFLRSIGFVETFLSTTEAIEEVLADLEGTRQQRQLEGFDPTRIPVDGHEFEHWVAEALRKFGWDASPTMAAGDQGIDVIAVKNGLKLGIQCKLYSQSVGNSAVQQALAGARYHGCHRAAVLSNAAFTKSAIDLAAAADVILLSQYDLPDLDRRFLGTPSI